VGIHDRDYMKRRADDEGDRSTSSSESNAEEFLTRFLQRHPRLFFYVGVGLAAVVVVVIIVVVVANRSNL
jgi:hypothetical protein